MMRAFIRADASETLGIGHIMRCLALSEELTRQGQQAIFICRDISQFMAELIVAKGCTLLHIPVDCPIGGKKEAAGIIELIHRNSIIQSADWLIVDHYSLDDHFEGSMRRLFTNIMVIDDLADRSHDCDILLDSSLNESKSNSYTGLIPESATLLMGPRYALLRSEFTEVRKTLQKRIDEEFTRIFICFGGTDPTNETLKTIKAIRPLLHKRIKLSVVIGQTNPQIEALTQQIRGDEIEFLIQPPSIAALMSVSDLAICAGGGMTLERYCMGLPGIVIAVADNQIEVAQQSERLGIDKFAGLSAEVTEAELALVVERTLHLKTWHHEARNKAMDMVDGKGVSRVVNALITRDHLIELRDAGDDELLFLWECRNEEAARQNSANTDEVPLEEHIKWLELSREMYDRKLMVAWSNNERIAVVRLDCEQYKAVVSINIVKEHRGKGYARPVIQELERTAMEWNHGIHTLEAVIRKNNEISIRSFVKAGYLECSRDNDFIIMHKPIARV